jgi:lysozyme
MLRTEKRGVDIIKAFEGLKLQAYFCPAGVPTIGYGHTRTVTKADVTAGKRITPSEAEELLKQDLRTFEAAVWAATGGDLNQAQFDALVSLAFNIGVAGLKKSTVLKAHIRGDFESASRAFGLWNKSKGKTLPGLTRRRAAEAALYLEPEDAKALSEDMPQAIEEETPMTASRINQVSAVAGATAGVAAVAETVNTVSSLKAGVDSLGDWLLPVALLSIIVACGYIIYTRWEQRKKGWA